MSDYIRRQDVLNLPQSIERNLRGEVVERSIDVKAIESIEPADVVPVVRCKDCKFCCRNDAQDWYWCERGLVVMKVRLDDFCSHGEKREE